MLSYCLKCSTESKNRKIAITKKEKLMFLLKWAVCGTKKSLFIKDQEASGLLSSLGIKAGLDRIPL